MAVNHAYDHQTFFTIVLPIVKELHSKRVFKDLFRQFETNSVLGVVVSFALDLLHSNFRVIYYGMPVVKSSCALDFA